MSWRFAVLLSGLTAFLPASAFPVETGPVSAVQQSLFVMNDYFAYPPRVGTIAYDGPNVTSGLDTIYIEKVPSPAGSILPAPVRPTGIIQSYWDVTGGRRPTDYVGPWAYGPDWLNVFDARVEWLLWFSRGRIAPPLATITTAGGAITQYPRDPIGTNARNGARFTLGYLLPETTTWLEGRFWGVENSSETFAVSSGGLPILSQPILNVSTGQRINLAAAPGFASGNLNVLSRNSLYGGDAWLRQVGWDDGYHRLAMLAGYQFSRMDDSMVIQSSSTLAPGNTVGPAGLTVAFQDAFRTQNEFHGASLGLVTGIRKNALSLEVLGKLGLGDMRETVIVSGTRTTTAPSGASVTKGVGLLALPSNEGTQTHDFFTVVPELNINGILHISPQWQAMIGYSFIYWSNAVLAGNQIDPRVNPTQFPGPTVGPVLPQRLFNRTDFLVQGLSLGAEYRW